LWLPEQQLPESAWLPSKFAKQAEEQPAPLGPTSSAGQSNNIMSVFVTRHQPENMNALASRSAGQEASGHPAVLVMAIGMLDPSTRDTSYQSLPLLSSLKVHSATDAGGTPVPV